MSSKEEIYYGYEEHAGSLIASQHGQSRCPLLQTNPQPPRGPPRAPRPEEATPVSYLVFMPKPSTHRMHDPGSIVPHIRPKLLTDNQISLIKYNYYISNVCKD
jgi:hypothetical protein